MAFGKLGEKFNNFFAMDDEDEYQDQEDEQTQAAPKEPSNHGQYRSNKVVSMNSPVGKTAKIVVYEPRIYFRCQRDWFAFTEQSRGRH